MTGFFEGPRLFSENRVFWEVMPAETVAECLFFFSSSKATANMFAKYVVDRY